MAFEDSILTSTKKALGVPQEYDVYDLDIALYINSALNTLMQIGVGPDEGFEISGEGEKWADFLQNERLLNSVKLFVVLTVRMDFDPPTTGPQIEALRKRLDEVTWRINTMTDHLGIRKKNTVPEVPVNEFPVYQTGV